MKKLYKKTLQALENYSFLKYDSRDFDSPLVTQWGFCDKASQAYRMNDFKSENNLNAKKAAILIYIIPNLKLKGKHM